MNVLISRERRMKARSPALIESIKGARSTVRLELKGGGIRRNARGGNNPRRLRELALKKGERVFIGLKNVRFFGKIFIRYEESGTMALTIKREIVEEIFKQAVDGSPLEVLRVPCRRRGAVHRLIP